MLVAMTVVLAAMPSVAAAEETTSPGSQQDGEPETPDTSSGDGDQPEKEDALIKQADAEIRVVAGCVSITDGKERLVVGSGCEEESPGAKDLAPLSDGALSGQDAGERTSGGEAPAEGTVGKQEAADGPEVEDPATQEPTEEPAHEPAEEPEENTGKEETPREILDSLLAECESRQTVGEDEETSKLAPGETTSAGTGATAGTGEGTSESTTGESTTGADSEDEGELSDEDCEALVNALSDREDSAAAGAASAPEHSPAGQNPEETTTAAPEPTGPENAHKQTAPDETTPDQAIQDDAAPDEATAEGKASPPAEAPAEAAEQPANKSANVSPAEHPTVHPAEPAKQPAQPAAHSSEGTPEEAPAEAPAAAAEQDNPFEGEALYVDPESEAANEARNVEGSEPEKAEALQEIAETPQADWFDSSGASPDDVRAAVEARVAEVAEKGALPVLVAYNIPARDCNGASGGGAATPAEYEQWIRAFGEGIGDRKAIVILEPDALALMDCLSEEQQQEREALIQDAIDTLEAKPNTSVYVDAGHSRMKEPDQMADRLQEAGVEAAQGFATNVSNFQETGSEVDYGEEISKFLDGKTFVIDTSRNGAGPGADDQWCNPPDRALGERPTTDTAAEEVDAYLWIKPPGESDGECGGGPPAGQFSPDYAEELAGETAGGQGSTVGEVPAAQAANTEEAEEGPESQGWNLEPAAGSKDAAPDSESTTGLDSQAEAAADYATVPDGAGEAAPAITVPEEQPLSPSPQPTPPEGGDDSDTAGDATPGVTVPEDGRALHEDTASPERDGREGLLQRTFGSETANDATEGAAPEQEPTTPPQPETTENPDLAKDPDLAKGAEEDTGGEKGPLERVYFKVFGVFGAGDDGTTKDRDSSGTSNEQGASGVETAGPVGETPEAAAEGTTSDPGQPGAGPGAGKADDGKDGVDKVMNLFGFVSAGSEDSASQPGA